MTTPDIDAAMAFLDERYGRRKGYAVLGFKSEGASPISVPYDWPNGRAKIRAELERRAQHEHVFYSPFLFETPKRKQGQAIHRDVLWLDMDGEPGRSEVIEALSPFRVSSSGRKRRGHLYFPLSTPLDDEAWHRLARQLRDAVGGGADAKIADNDWLRLPGTVNFKTQLKAPRLVRVTADQRHPIDPDDLKALISPYAPETPPPARVHNDALPDAERVPQSAKRGPVRSAMHRETSDRSQDVYALVATCREYGLTIGQTLTLAIEYPPAQDKWENNTRNVARDVQRCWNNHETRKPNVTKKKKNETPTPNGRLKLVRASEIRPKRQKWLLPNRIPLGALTLMGGREGSGKSSICVDYAARVTRGELDGELHGTPRSVIYFATEDDRSTVLVPRLTVARADLSRVIFLDPEEPGDDLLNLPSDNDELDGIIRDYAVSLVVLDPILSALDGSVNDTNPRELRRELEPINQMAARHDCAFLGIAHFNKRESSDIGVLMSGLLVWSQVARATIGVIHDPEDNDPDSFIMSTGKNNSASRGTSSLTGRLVGVEVDTDDGPTTVARVEWLGESDLSVGDVMTPENQPKKDVERWLEGLLAEHGPMTRPQVLERAEATTFSKTSIDRAKKNLGLDSDKGYQGNAIWSLPSRSRATHDDTEKIENFEKTDNVGGAPSSFSSLSTSSTFSTLSEVARESGFRPATKKTLDFSGC